MPEQTNPADDAAERKARLDELVEKGLMGQIASEFADQPAADIAELLSHYPIEEIVPIFKALPADLQPDVLAELPSDIGARLAEALPADTAAYPGHGPATTVGDERLNNPFIGEFAEA